MATQVSVRLPDDQVRFLDALVEEGSVSSRSDGVSRALVQLQRQHRAAADLEQLIGSGTSGGEALAIARATSTTPLPLD